MHLQLPTMHPCYLFRHTSVDFSVLQMPTEHPQYVLQMPTEHLQYVLQIPTEHPYEATCVFLWLLLPTSNRHKHPHVLLRLKLIKVLFITHYKLKLFYSLSSYLSSACSSEFIIRMVKFLHNSRFLCK